MDIMKIKTPLWKNSIMEQKQQDERTMIITEITEISKSRCRIVLDQEIAFALYKGDLRIYHLRAGEEIKPEVYSELMEEVLPKRAKKRCLNLLRSRDYTKKELSGKLKLGGYPEAVIEEAISYVESYGYIGDEYYARKYIETYRDTKSRKRIEQDLMQKGVPKAVIDRIYSGFSDEEDPEILQIKRLLHKKGYFDQEMEEQQRMKIFAYLLRKGYSAEKIRTCAGNIDIYD